MAFLINLGSQLIRLYFNLCNSRNCYVKTSYQCLGRAWCRCSQTYNKNKILKYHAKRLFKGTQNQSGLVIALNPFVDDTNYYYYDTDKISKWWTSRGFHAQLISGQPSFLNLKKHETVRAFLMLSGRIGREYWPEMGQYWDTHIYNKTLHWSVLVCSLFSMTSVLDLELLGTS